ncbi:MAG: helix-turn-helix domain-containing protein [Treponema sp.]|nr:helix-turn-helix domain-containing protein [Treponema sp.]
MRIAGLPDPAEAIPRFTLPAQGFSACWRKIFHICGLYIQNNAQYWICQEKYTLFWIFFQKSFDNIDMGSMFWENTRKHLNNLEKTQIWLAGASKVGKTVINSGIARKSSPTVDNAYKISRVFQVTIEELLDGEAGMDYVRQWARQDGKVYQPPERIADIVDLLNKLSDRDLGVIKKSVKAMLGTDEEPKEEPRTPSGEVG